MPNSDNEGLGQGAELPNVQKPLSDFQSIRNRLAQLVREALGPSTSGRFKLSLFSGLLAKGVQGASLLILTPLFIKNLGP